MANSSWTIPRHPNAPICLTPPPHTHTPAPPSPPHTHSEHKLDYATTAQQRPASTHLRDSDQLLLRLEERPCSGQAACVLARVGVACSRSVGWSSGCVRAAGSGFCACRGPGREHSRTGEAHPCVQRARARAFLNRGSPSVRAEGQGASSPEQGKPIRACRGTGREQSRTGEAHSCKRARSGPSH
eukprot:364100-Chlamydomonas_euryale.AAC.69